MPSVSNWGAVQANDAGTETSPITISNAQELDEIRNATESHYYVLTNDIDLSDDEWSENEGWEPIGTELAPFRGHLDGKGYTISGLTIDRTNENYVGLFGNVGNASFTNLNLTIDSVTGNDFVGGLVGYSRYTEITGINVTGDVTGNEFIGGLIGQADTDTIINHSESHGNIAGNKYIGGLVGDAFQVTIDSSFAYGDISGEQTLGGLVGYADGNNEQKTTISKSGATGNVQTDGPYVGGLIGHGEYMAITDSYATGNIAGDEMLGGLVGLAYYTSIRSSFAEGTVEALREDAGGLVGTIELDSEVVNSYATGDVISKDGNGKYIGGVVGSSYKATIANTYSIGLVVGQEDSSGGILGAAYLDDVSVVDSYWNTTVNASSSLNPKYGEGKTEEELKEKATFVNWDFDTVWTVMEGLYFPTLQAFTENELTHIEVWVGFVRGQTPIAVPGDRISVIASAHFSNGESIDITEVADYNVNDEAIVTFTGIQEFLGRSTAEFAVHNLGAGEIIVNYNGLSESINFEVQMYHSAIRSDETFGFWIGETLWIEDSTTYIKTPMGPYEGGQIHPILLDVGNFNNLPGDTAGDIVQIDLHLYTFGELGEDFVITMGYDPQFDGDQVDIYSFNEETGTWEPQNAALDETNNKLSLKLDALAIYGVFAKEKVPVDDDDDDEKDNGGNDKDDKKPPVKDDDGDKEPPTDGESKEMEETEEKKGDSLPNTATNTFNFMFLGIIMIMAGAVLFYIVRKKRSEKDVLV